MTDHSARYYDLVKNRLEPDELQTVPRQPSEGSIGDEPRPFTTTEPVDLYVAPDSVSGDDTLENADVDSNNPLDTFNEALSRIPQFPMHQFRIFLQDGVHSSGTGAFTGPPMIHPTWNLSGSSPNDAVKILGNSADNTAVELDINGFGYAMDGAEIDNTGLEAHIAYLTIHGDINNKGGQLRVYQCRFTGQSAGGTAAINGKGRGVTWLDECEILDGNNHVFHLGQPGAVGIVDGCTGSVNDYTFWLANGATGILKSGRIGKKGDYEIDNAGRFVDADGQHFPVEHQLVDDFADGRLFRNRVSSEGPMRPEWSDNGAQSPGAVPGEANFPAGDTNDVNIDTEHHNLASDIAFDLKLGSATPSAGAFMIMWCWDGTDYWRLRFEADGQLKLQKRIGGSTTTVTTSSYTRSTSWQRYEYDRTTGGDHTVDETSPPGPDGTTTQVLSAIDDDSLPNRGGPWKVRIDQSMDTTVDFRQLSVGTYRA